MLLLACRQQQYSGISPGSANQCTLGDVYLGSNLSRNSTHAQVGHMCSIGNWTVYKRAHGYFARDCMPSTHAFQQGLRIMQTHIDHVKKPGHVCNPAT